MGVVSGDGMRLKARNDRPRLPGTYPPTYQLPRRGRTFIESSRGCRYGTCIPRPGHVTKSSRWVTIYGEGVTIYGT